MKLKRSMLFLFCLVFFLVTANLAGALVNDNTIFKSIKSPDGDMIDCVDISHQPAFDHPLLTDHTIKMIPSYHPEGKYTSDGFESNTGKNVNQINQLWQLSGECPEGTIPIIRRTENRAIPMKKNPRNTTSPRLFSSVVSTDAVDQSRHEYAFTATPTGEYYGTRATISAWQPHVERTTEFSLSQIWVAGVSDSTVNTIEVGWIVYPQLFGDNQTRLFIYWTTDNYQSTGCYNLLCSGFVQTSSQMAIGGSIYSAPGNHPEITLLVWKDEGTDAWWLQYNGTILGYWPTTIFTILNGTSSLVEWGGEIINSNINGRHTATQMGSGQFAQAGLGRASYFRNLLVVNDENTLIDPPSIGSTATNQNCYNITVGMNSDWGNFFYYGGPGRNPNCP